MKNIFLISILILLFSCKKDQILTYEAINSLSGKIENWNLGSNMKIYFGNNEVYGTSIIDSMGNFNILNLSIPINNLIPIDSTDYREGYKISNHNVKITQTTLLRVFQGNDLNTYLGFVQEGNRQIDSTHGDPYNINNGDYSIFYIYVTEDVSINANSTGVLWGNKFIMNCNMNLKKGWNKYQYSFTPSNFNSVTAPDPSNAKWFFNKRSN